MSVPAGFIVTKAPEAAEKVSGALTTPIWGRKTAMVWDVDEEEWVPDTQEREVSLTPAAVLAVGVAAVGIGGALWLMGTRAQVLSVDQREGIKQETTDGTKQREDEVEALEGALARTVRDLGSIGEPIDTNPTVISLRKALKEAKADLRSWRFGRVGERIPFRWAQRDQFTGGPLTSVFRLFGG